MTQIDEPNLDEQIEDIISHPDGSVSDNQFKAIKTLITNAEKQARLAELKNIAQDNWQKPIPEQYIFDRIKELENL